MRDPSNNPFEFSNIERVEVLKGPASVLFGQSDPGGTINVITKQPLSDPFYAVDATIGSYDFYRGAVDLSGPFFVGDREGDLDNTFELQSYFRTDAAIFYKRDQFRAALNFRNLFNVDYFENAFSDLRVAYGEPITVQGTVSWEF